MSQGIGRPKEMDRDWGVASLVEQSSQYTHNTFQLSLLSYISMVHGAQNNLNSNIKGHWPQIIITNITIMKSFKYCELPKCDTDIDWANAVGKMAPKDLSDAGLPQTFNL